VDISAMPEWRLSPVRLVDPAHGDFPVLLEPDREDRSAPRYVERMRAQISELLLDRGAVLFRGFKVPDEPHFEQTAQALSSSLESRYGDLVKRDTASFVYDATWYPKDRAILFHNEGSHTLILPHRQLFFCGRDQFTGGETPFVDCRALYRAIEPSLINRFERLGLSYVRNFIRGVDVSWQDFFRTQDKAEVDRRCRAQGVITQWKRDGTLRTTTKAPAVIQHPVSGVPSFCNQIMLHHPACLDAKTRDALLSLLSPNDLPRSVCFGDGSPISEQVVAELLALTVQHAVRFRWQQGDVLLLDNFSVAHARSPFEGDRQILVAIGEVRSRQSFSQPGHGPAQPRSFV
jgi:alpha-ketoglutarate-dependent taurine dioxygenase